MVITAGKMEQFSVVLLLFPNVFYGFSILYRMESFLMCRRFHSIFQLDVYCEVSNRVNVFFRKNANIPKCLWTGGRFE